MRQQKFSLQNLHNKDIFKFCSHKLMKNIKTVISFQNSALRAHRVLESMRPFLRGIFGKKGIVIEATTDKPIFSDPNSS